MGGGSKKQKRKAERKAIRQNWAELEASKLPPKVALPAHLDSSNYQLNFDLYNHGQCQLDQLTSSLAEKLIKKMAEITRYNSRTIASSNLIRDNINNDGVYRGLFRGLESDTEIKEIQFAGDGRIFCHLVNDHPDSVGIVSNYCCLIAVWAQHGNIDK